MRHFARLALLGLASVFALAPIARADDSPFAAEGIRVVREDAAGVAFEMDVADPVFASVGAADEHVVEMGIPFFQLGGATGTPGLPERVVWIGIPDGARVSVDGAGLDPQDYGAVRLAPRISTLDLQPPGEPGDRDRVHGAYPERVSPYLEAKDYRQAKTDFPVAEVAGITGLRSQRVAAIRLRPAVYDPASGRLSLYRKLTITVRFAGGTTFASRPPVEGAFEPLYRYSILNYESARSFRRSFADRMRTDARERLGTAGLARPALSSAVGFDVSPLWVKLGVDFKGIQRVSYEDLQSIGYALAGTPTANLRLYTRGGAPILDETTYCDTCGLNEVAIGVVDGGDGHFDPGDYILFYGLPPSDWLDDFTGPGTTPNHWLDHPYETKNFYWLTWQSNAPTPARRWTTRDVAPNDPNAWPAPDYAARVHLEQDFQYRPNMYDFNPAIPWDQWAWIEFYDKGGAQNFLVDTPGAQVSQPARLFARFWGTSQETGSATLPDHVLDVSFNGVPLAEKRWSGRFRQDIDSTGIWIRETGNRIIFQAPLLTDPKDPNRRDTQTFLFWELHFRRRFQAVNDVIEFASPDTTGSVQLGLAAFTPAGAAGLRLLDVSDPTNPVELKNWTTRDTTGGEALYLDETLSGPRFYYGAPLTHFRRPSIEKADVRNLGASGQGADYLVIVYDEFEPQALRLADLRSHILPSIPNARTQVVRISDILAWYSGGRMDPTAVRNFLYDVSKRWNPVPQYVCFFGDASYDFKNALHLATPGHPPALVPSYVHGYFAGQYMTDDWLADMDLGTVDPPIPGMISPTDDIPDYIIGRLPAGTAGEADELVDGKIIPYDSRPTFGEWRNRVLLVADDFYQGFLANGQPAPDGLYGAHQYQSELLDAVLPPVLDRQKIYMSKYPFGVGTEKPAVNADIKKWVNQGTLLWNFVGHGNPFKMADENAFIISDVPTLTNADKLTFVIAASCDVGKFDDPIIVGLGEALVKSAAGGAIATFSSSDIAYSSQNSSLNQELFRQLFVPSANGFDVSLGQACFLIKRRIDATENDRKYTLQGDPGTRLGSPHLDVRLQLFDDETGAALVDSLPRGRRVRVEAQVQTSHDTTSASVFSSYQGTASVWITDSAPADTFRLSPPPSGPLSTYTYNPGGVFHGDLPVKDGRTTARFYVPLEGLLGPRAKARVYVQNASDDGVGALTVRMVDGVPSDVDTTGPTISLRFVDGKTVEAPDAPLRVVIEDAHGINLTGHTIPNAITLTIDDKTRYDLTETFRYDPGSYTRGTLVFTLPGLAPGGHTISVSAADNFAAGILGRRNRSQASIDFDVASGGGLPLTQVLNFPNPFHSGHGTQFVISGLAQSASVEVRVYTVDGQLVRRLTGTGGPGEVQVGWDGKDDAGSQVAMGVYIYRAVVRPSGGGGASDVEGRLAVIP
ncbi:MAG TPA: type IX secretion system sortase PorU [Candidatus Eisenbacteria bacterium]|nr:type IX secretion system sortase PorU [Candidatus Eisenbacteria bacterium]